MEKDSDKSLTEKVKLQNLKYRMIDISIGWYYSHKRKKYCTSKLHGHMLVTVCKTESSGRVLTRLKIVVMVGGAQGKGLSRGTLALFMFDFFTRMYLWITYVIFKKILCIKMFKRPEFQFLELSQSLKLTLQRLSYSWFEAKFFPW